MTKKKFLINDFVMCEDSCNMHCDYCLAQDSEMKENHDFTRKEDGTIYSVSGKGLEYVQGSPLKQVTDQTLEVVESLTDTSILKVSGGEVLLVKNFPDFLHAHAPRYEKVQLLTNGSLVNEEFVANVSKIPNLQIQLSLDSHSLEGNSYRVKHPKLHQRILDGLDLFVKYGMTVEISSVLTDRSLLELYNFAKYVTQYEGKVFLNPYPIRGNYRCDYFPTEEGTEKLKQLIDEYQDFQEVVAPLPYLEHLYQFLKDGKKKFRCLVSRFLMGSFHDGHISSCPLGWQSLGTIYEDSPTELIDAIATEGICKVLTAKRPMIQYCKECFSTYDIFSLYVNGDVSLEDVQKVPLFKGEKIGQRIQELKKECESL